MPLYAHAVVEDPRDGSKFQRGSEVPEDLPGIEELQESGSVQNEPYEGEEFPTPQPPPEIVIDGVRYTRDDAEGVEGAQVEASVASDDGAEESGQSA